MQEIDKIQRERNERRSEEHEEVTTPSAEASAGTAGAEHDAQRDAHSARGDPYAGKYPHGDAQAAHERHQNRRCRIRPL
jgi:hypothetical protein